ncbi:MAG: cupin domain-containing protein, partial [Acinetobacter sp.]|nr:cupin domain-containing protein [Acinetobacter sp.]
MSQIPLDVLGHITAEQFLTEYWQKKPLLVRNALPEVIDLLEPEEIQQLALEEHVTARLIQQQGKQHDQWQVKSSPLSAKDFKKLPPYWTLLVQALDHHSLDIAELWKKFYFLPQWRRDDIMISYAPQGGSVGQHFDYYDVFLVQAYGQRRWQLGQMCDEHSEFVPNQPLKLLPEMQVWFDEVLNPGDLLYVPPGLSHYGVAENECLTLSFGFRMPNVANMMDRTSDQFADQARFKNPLSDIARQKVQAIGEIQAAEIQDLKAKLIEQLQHSDAFDQAIMALMSEAKYPDHIPEVDEITFDDVQDLSESDAYLSIEPASRLLYRHTANTLEFWANGEKLCLNAASLPIFQRLADGEQIALSDLDFT